MEHAQQRVEPMTLLVRSAVDPHSGPCFHSGVLQDTAVVQGLFGQIWPSARNQGTIIGPRIFRLTRHDGTLLNKPPNTGIILRTLFTHPCTEAYVREKNLDCEHCMVSDCLSSQVVCFETPNLHRASQTAMQVLLTDYNKLLARP